MALAGVSTLTGVSSTALVPRVVQGTCAALPTIAACSSAVASAVGNLASSAGVPLLPATFPSILSTTAATVTNVAWTALSAVVNAPQAFYSTVAGYIAPAGSQTTDLCIATAANSTLTEVLSNTTSTASSVLTGAADLVSSGLIGTANLASSAFTAAANATNAGLATVAAATGMPPVAVIALALATAATAAGAYYLATREPTTEIITSEPQAELAETQAEVAETQAIAAPKKKNRKKRKQVSAEGLTVVVSPAKSNKSYTVVVTSTEITVTNGNDKYRVEILQGQSDITTDLISTEANQEKVQELAEKVIDVLLSRNLLNTAAATNVAFSDQGEVTLISRADMNATEIADTVKPETTIKEKALTTSFKALEITKLVSEAQTQKTLTKQSLQPKKASSMALHDSYLTDVNRSGHCMDTSILHQLRGCPSNLPTAEEARTEIRQPVIDMLNDLTQRETIVQKLKADPHFFESAVDTFTNCSGKGAKVIERLLKPLGENPVLTDTNISHYSNVELHNLLLAYATYISGEGVYLDGLFLSLLPLTQMHRKIRVIVLEDSVGNKTDGAPFMVGARYQYAKVKKHDQPIYIWYNGSNHYKSFDKITEQGKSMLQRVTETERDSALRGFFDMISQARSQKKDQEIIKAYQGLKVQHPQAFNKIKRELLTHKQNGETTGSQVLTRLLNEFQGSSLRNVLEVLKEDKPSSLHADPFLAHGLSETNH